MGWETRRNGRRYYYRKERAPDGRVRSVYVGTGPFARALAACDRARCGEAALRRLSLAPLDDALASLRGSETRLRLWRDAYLVSCGYRQHRGQWRRRRGLDLDPFPPPRPAGRPDPMPKNQRPPVSEGYQVSTGVGPAFTVPAGTSEAALERLEAAAKALDAERPRWSDVADFRAALAELPADAFEAFGFAVARRRVGALVAGVDPSADSAGDHGVVVAIAEAEIDRRAAALALPDDSPLVSAAVRQAALAETVAEHAAGRYARCVGTRGGYQLSEADSLDRRLNSATLRHARALATVAKLREVEGKERRRAERHGLQMDAARRALPPRGQRPATTPDRPARSPQIGPPVEPAAGPSEPAS